MIRTAVIPAAGLGTRFLPATKAVPKEMIPIIDKPTVQYIVEEAVQAGVRHIVFIIGRNKDAVANHFDFQPELERHLVEKGKDEELASVRRMVEDVSYSFVRQNEPRGLGHAVLCARHVIGENEPFAVMLGDDVMVSSEPVLGQMIRQYEQIGAPLVALEQVAPDAVNRYGIVDGTQMGQRLFKLSEMVEKPSIGEAPSNLAIMGRYILDPRIFGLVEQTGAGAGGEIQLTDALRQYPEIYGFRYAGKRYDAGNKLEFLKAVVEFALAREEFREPFRSYLKSLDI